MSYFLVADIHTIVLLQPWFTVSVQFADISHQHTSIKQMLMFEYYNVSTRALKSQIAMYCTVH